MKFYFQKFTVEGFKRKLAQVVVSENLPFAMGDSEAWQDLFNYCNPSAKMPAPNTIKNVISSMYEIELERMKTILQVMLIQLIM